MKRRTFLAGAAAAAGTVPARAAAPFRLIITETETPLVPNSVQEFAQTLGYYKRAGVDVELVRVQQTPSAIAALRSGQGDMANIAIATAVELVARNQMALKAVLSPDKTLPFLVAAKKTLARPKDLEGKRIGVPLYTMSAALWLRGMLTDEYGVDFGTVRWLQGAIDHAGTHGTPTLPPGIRVANLEQNASDRSLWELLIAGEIDALMSAVIPHEFGTTDAVGRLFEDFAAEEQRYYRKTRIFPIMHMVALRRASYEEHPFIARSLYDALERSKQLAREALYEPGAPRVMLPFLPAYLEETKRVFGGDPWVYGIEPNRRTLEAQQEYLYREGLIAKRFPVEELFAPL